MYASFIFIAQLFTTIQGYCPSNAIFDVSTVSQQLYNMRKFLGGHTDVDLWFPFYKYASLLGQFKISTACDLDCYDFDSFLTKPCRWRNEEVSCDDVHDELDFIRMKGSWGLDEGEIIFGKEDRADGFFLIVGSEKKLPPTYSAMLVSDPIQCQEGDGLVKLKHWTSPGVKVRVCIRSPSMGKHYHWCSEAIKRNNTKFANVIIPGSISYTFEIVIEAYNFSLDAFGKQGGAAVIDDISYNASAIYECKLIPHIEALINVPLTSCAAVQCNFEFGSCMKKMDGSGWKTTNKEVGPRSSGIRSNLEDTYAYVNGPGTYSLALGPFTLPRPFGIEFCYYTASYKSKLIVYITRKAKIEKERIYESPEILGNRHHWICDKFILSNGTYDSVEFSAEQLRNKYSFVGLDQIGIVDPLKGKGACEK